MMKVFLVDDEIAIRENLRNSFPWEEHGFHLVGEAPDGEMALPMIRDLNPDILLTDIRMPFMDGLQLCSEIRRTMPWVCVIILSGYDDFAYAQKAISLGVREYLLKPLTAQELENALIRIRNQIQEERKERENLAAMRQRVSSGTHFLRDKLLASLFTDEGDRYEDEALLSQMRSMGINLSANCYVVLDIAFDEQAEKRIACRSALSALAEASGGTVFVCSAPKGARALVLGDNEKDVEERAYSFASSATHLPEFETSETLLIAIGETRKDYYEIRSSMRSARHVRHLMTASGKTERRIVGVNEVTDTTRMLSETELSPLYERLQYASAEDVEPILTEYTASLEPGLALGYLRIAALIAAQKILHDSDEDHRKVLNETEVTDALRMEGEGSFQKLVSLLQKAIAIRDLSGKGYDSSPVSRARIFMSQHYSNPNLMLQDVADEVCMSQSHFSTVFAQETGITFTQYLTALRLGKARELLTMSDMRSSQIAFEVGYNDAHYFSYLFKKNTGMTPSEYRRANKNEPVSNENKLLDGIHA